MRGFHTQRLSENGYRKRFSREPAVEQALNQTEKETFPGLFFFVVVRRGVEPWQIFRPVSRKTWICQASCLAIITDAPRERFGFLEAPIILRSAVRTRASEEVFICLLENVVAPERSPACFCVAGPDHEAVWFRRFLVDFLRKVR